MDFLSSWPTKIVLDRMTITDYVDLCAELTAVTLEPRLNKASLNVTLIATLVATSLNPYDYLFEAINCV